MKKIVILSGIIISTLFSCSTEDAPTYNQESSKPAFSKSTEEDFCITCRDSIGRDNDTLTLAIDPLKPRRD